MEVSAFNMVLSSVVHLGECLYISIFFPHSECPAPKIRHLWDCPSDYFWIDTKVVIVYYLE